MGSFEPSLEGWHTLAKLPARLLDVLSKRIREDIDAAGVELLCRFIDFMLLVEDVLANDIRCMQAPRLVERRPKEPAALQPIQMLGLGHKL